jgi:gentisate 1,2-dioxygenase
MATETRPHRSFDEFVDEADRLGLRVSRPDSHAAPPTIQPHLWKWSAIARLLPELGQHQDLATMGEVRRTFGLLNPVGKVHTTYTLNCSIQYILPGEVAPAHRHIATALRYVITGTGTSTTVEGLRLPMEPGDLLLTPSWHFHDHRHTGTEPMAWLDVLDVPLVNYCRANTLEPYSKPEQDVIAEVDDVLAAFASPGFLPANGPINREMALPIYRWETTKEALHNRARLAPDPYDAVTLQYVNPGTGGPVLKTIDCWTTLLQPGAHTRAHRHSTSTVYHVVEGQGSSIVDGQRFDWEKNDFLVIPNWCLHEHLNESSEDAILFSVNDRPVFDAFGWYREEPFGARDGHQEVTSVFQPQL